jgi:hypothetical protein
MPAASSGEQSVVGRRFAGQLSHDGDSKVHGGSRKATRLDLGPVALDGSLGEPICAGGNAPSEKFRQRAIVRSAGIRGATLSSTRLLIAASASAI